MSSNAAKGRKRGAAKTVAAEPAAAVPTLTVEETPAIVSSLGGESLPAPTTTKKPRSSKKTPPVVAIVTPAGITGSFLGEQRPLIAHLPVSSAEVSFEASNLVKTGTLPSAYDNGSEAFSYLEGVNEGASVSNNIIPITKPLVHPNEPKCKLASNYSEKLMVLFQDSNRYKKLPEKTEIACFWCCHSFNSHPIAIPSHILDEVWYMYGNYCSPECAASYLFKERIDAHVQWERFALLNSLYSDDAQVPSGSPVGIRPAPPREVLRMFGGSMDISEFRAAVHEKRLRIDVLTPPMVSIIQTMDTKPIDFYDQNLKNVFIRNDIQHKYNAPGAQGLRLRRSKPVKSRESTVEWAMQITEAT